MVHMQMLIRAKSAEHQFFLCSCFGGCVKATSALILKIIDTAKVYMGNSLNVDIVTRHREKLPFYAYPNLDGFPWVLTDRHLLKKS